MSQNQPRPTSNPTPTPTSSSPNVPSSPISTTTQSVSLVPSSPISTTTDSASLISPGAPAGGIVMTQPPRNVVSFYKIAPSQTITFGWNFTSILQDSERLTVSAIGENGNTYPVGPTDGVLPGTATKVVWDLHAWQTSNPQQPLAQGTYTLTMWDKRGPSAFPKPGLMQPFGGLRFGLYTAQAYIPFASGWPCAECPNGSVLSAAVHPAFAGFIVSFLVILLSGFHLLRSNA